MQKPLYYYFIVKLVSKRGNSNLSLEELAQTEGEFDKGMEA